MADTVDRPPWLEELLDVSAYDHPCGTIRLRETHISWILLTGTFAYKLRKPVAYGFVDFSTAAAREQDCHEELRLNRHFTPELYLDVVPVVRNGQDRVRMGGVSGHGGSRRVLEWAVRMRQFDDQAMADALLAQDALAAADFHRFGRDLALQHANLPVAVRIEEDPARRALQPALDNFELLLDRCPPAVRPRLQALQAQTEARHGVLAALCRQRHAEGHIRECHGDLHLGNLVQLEGRLRAFDCLEFNASLRWIDTASDVAFLLMDLIARHRADLGYAFLDGYLDQSGDYPAVRLLRFYAAYRAMVRAKVAALGQAGPDPGRNGELAAYLDEAAAWLASDAPFLLICCGLSGSGKSFVASQLVSDLGAVRLRSDVLRKTLAGLAPDDRGQAIYDRAMTRRVYQGLQAQAETLLADGYRLILDATHLTAADRQMARQLAQRCGVPFAVLYCRAPDAVLEQRVSARLAQGSDPSDADLEVLRNQQRSFEPPVGDDVLVVDTDVPGAAVRAAAELRARFGRVA